jgi:hypothetical protein
VGWCTKVYQGVPWCTKVYRGVPKCTVGWCTKVYCGMERMLNESGFGHRLPSAVIMPCDQRHVITERHVIADHMALITSLIAWHIADPITDHMA